MQSSSKKGRGWEIAAGHQVKTVFLVTFKLETYEEAKLVMRKIMEKTGGFFCGDTEDFTPMFA